MAWSRSPSQVWHLARARQSFVLSGLSSEDITISNVSGAYGTAPEGTPAAQQESDAPEPATMSVLAGGLALLAVKRLRRG